MSKFGCLVMNFVTSLNFENFKCFISLALANESETYIQEKSAGIEDLFPKCVVKTKEDGIDLLVEEEDKYSALRGLTTGDEFDEFGDFLTAAPVEPSSRLAPLVEYQANIQVSTITNCLFLDFT